MGAIIFDFDGTIADTLDYFKDFLVREARISPLSETERNALYGLTLLTIARRLGHPWRRMAQLYFAGRSQMKPIIETIHPFAGMQEVLQTLHAEGHQIFIISSNSVFNMNQFLKYHDLDTYVVDIIGGVVLFGKGPALRRLMRKHHLQVSESIYVGDEVRDVKGAKAAGMRVIAVCWGYASIEDLRRSKPTGIAVTPSKLLRQLEEI